jgi:hypothetical protein
MFVVCPSRSTGECNYRTYFLNTQIEAGILDGALMQLKGGDN